MIGRVKTRLARDAGNTTAYRIYHQLLAHSVQTAHRSGLPAELWYTPNAQHPTLQKLARRYEMSLRRQSNQDLGQRMYAALQDGLNRADAVVLIGCDCPEYSAQYLHQAFAQLSEHRIVLGPAKDGGYVLIGARRVHPHLFRGITWSSDQVLAQTRSRLEHLGWNWAELTSMQDIDTHEDWLKLGDALTAQVSGGRVSQNSAE